MQNAVWDLEFYSWHLLFRHLLKQSFHFLRCVESFSDVVPIKDIEQRIYKLAPFASVFEIIGVFPDINYKQGDNAPLGELFMVLTLQDGEPFGERLVT
jgi:hypothetical protein